MPHPDGSPKGLAEHLEWVREHPCVELMFDDKNRSPADLEYFAAYYEEIAAKADSDADPENEELFYYWDHAAYGEAYWWGEEFRAKRHLAYI